MRRVFLCLLLAFTVVSCAKDTTGGGSSDVGNAPQEESEVISASIDAIKDAVESSKSIQKRWSVGDSLCVVGANTYKWYKFEGEAEKRNGTFVCSETMSPLEFDFEGFYAIAPYAEFEITPFGLLRCYSSSEGTSLQRYSTNLRDNNLLFATSEDGKKFTFKSILGYLRVPLMGNKKVKCIELINNSGVAISGRYYFAVGQPATVLWDSGSERKKSILLDCGEGVQLMSTPTDFYFAIKPMTLTEGVTLNITFTDGSTSIHKTTKSITISPNSIHPIERVSTTNGDTQTISISFTGTTFLVPTIEGLPTLSGFVSFGDGEIRTINSTEKYNYTDDKDSHDISFNLSNATKIHMYSCEDVSVLDLSNF